MFKSFFQSYLRDRGWRFYAFEVGMALLVVAALLPVWLPQWLPLQDLPQHLAAIRIFADYSDPTLAFSEYFRLTPFQTQYLGYYSAVWVLSWLVEVDTANRLFLSGCLAATPYAMRYLLAKLDRPAYLSFFVFPLLYNTFLLLGFINFIAAIPLMLGGLGLAARLREGYSTRVAVGLGGVGVACFFMHVVPFAFLAVGTALLGAGLSREGGAAAVKSTVRGTLWRWIPMLPAGIISILWTFFSPAGTSTTEAVGDGGSYRAWMDAFRELPNWLTNLTPGPHDDRLLIVFGLLLVAAVVTGLTQTHDRSLHEGPGDDEGESDESDGQTRFLPAPQAVGVLAPLALLGYFTLPVSYDWIWPISPRFGLLAILLAVPALPRTGKWPAYLLSGLLVGVSLAQFYHVGNQFRAYSQEEVGRLDEAIEAIPPGRTVAGLIFDRGSRNVRFSPFIHAVAYYQAEKGGAVMFTFADFPQSPVRFREGNRPPKVRPRWEWTPHRVDPRVDLTWYDYVLVRGGPGRVRQQKDTFERVFESPRWTVWKRLE